MHKPRLVFLQKDWEDNLGVQWVCSYVQAHGFDARILVEEKNTYKELAYLNPAVVGYSCMTGQQTWVRESVRKARAAGMTSLCLMGGPHPTFFPEELEASEVDGICRGEGESVVLSLLQALEAGDNYRSLLGTWWKADGQSIRNPMALLLEDLDTLPPPDRSYYGRYPFLATNPYKTFITGRGCPFNCTFCFNHALVELYGKPARYIRRHSPEYVLDDLLRVQRAWGLDEVRFSDDHFTMDIQWLRAFLPAYSKHVGRPYSVNARVDTLSEEKIAMLAESGCRLVCFGVETGREDLRNAVLKKVITNDHIHEAARLLKKYKIPFLTSNIIGLPNETPRDAWATVRLNQKIRTPLPWYSMMQYFPGTQIFDQAVAAELITCDFTPDMITSYFSNEYIRQPHMKELRNIHSLSIITTRLPCLTPLVRWLARQVPPNAFFRFLFALSNGVLAARRARFPLLRMIKGFRYYLKK
ncbi:MAG: B12-binding domain-containing radical SAM protein, partial [Betaproteobacteria bacterium]|nr:B12-binding domain-containing radical SAM protein [Betaproteobacteria bacterium]